MTMAGAGRLLALLLAASLLAAVASAAQVALRSGTLLLPDRVGHRHNNASASGLDLGRWQRTLPSLSAGDRRLAQLTTALQRAPRGGSGGRASRRVALGGDIGEDGAEAIGVHSRQDEQAGGLAECLLQSPLAPLQARRWWQEPDADQFIVSFGRGEGTDHLGTLESLLAGKGAMADYFPHDGYLVVASAAAAEQIDERLQGSAAVTPFVASLKRSPELELFAEVLRSREFAEQQAARAASWTGQREEEEEEAGEEARTSVLADVVPGLNVEVVSPTNLLLSGNGTLGAAGRKGEIFRLRQFGGPEALANMGYTVRLRGAENATLDVFSVAVDLQGRVLLSVSTPAVEGIDITNVEAVSKAASANCCGGGEWGGCAVFFPPRTEEEGKGRRRRALSFQVAVPVAELDQISQALASLPYVNWIEPVLEARIFNHFASSILQSGVPNFDDPSSRPFWEANLTGQGQVVGVGDTGLDTKSCYFYDNEHEVGGEHYKVVGYRGFADYVDTSGHGTHVVGSIVGKSRDSSYSDFNGMAPDAKVAFTDLGLSYGDLRGLIAPETMEEYYQYAYNLGARIHSDSWGGLSSAYTRSAREVDEYHFYHPEFLSFIAAGNDGEYLTAEDVESTVSTPATCKNALAVGASLTVGLDYPPKPDPVSEFEIASPASDRGGFKVVSSLFSPPLTFEPGEELEVVMADPPRACTPVSNETLATYTGKLVLVERGDCFFIEKVYSLRKGGPRGVIVFNNQESATGFFKMASAERGISTDVPTGSVPLSTGRALMDAMASSANRSAIVRFVGPVEEVILPFENIADYSSFGPTRDGRVKPDIVAPGEAIMSATSVDSDNECRTRQISGTSMATPLVSGMAAVARQYMMEGFYGDGTSGSADPWTPTGALLKALIINGAVAMKGTAQSGLPLEAPPSFRQGWGRMQLAETLPLEATRQDFALQFADWKDLSSSGDSHSYCLTMPDQAPGNSRGGGTMRPISVTLAWMDAPGSLSGGGVLVNDLDLVVQTPPGEPEASRGSAAVPDRVNNIEKAKVMYPQPGASYGIQVKAYKVQWRMGDGKGQIYAVAATGPVGMKLEPCGDAADGYDVECTCLSENRKIKGAGELRTSDVGEDMDVDATAP